MNKYCSSMAIFWPLFLLAGLAGCRSAAPVRSIKDIGPIYHPTVFRRQIDRRFHQLWVDDELLPTEMLLANVPSDCRIDLPDMERGRLLDGPDLYRRVMQSTVMVGHLNECANPRCAIKVHFGGATGVFITRDGMVATNRHVVMKADSVSLGIATADGKVFAVTKVLAMDPVSDLALLQTDAKDVLPLPIAPYAPIGTPVAVVSHPGKEFFEYSEGVVTNYRFRPVSGAEGENAARVHMALVMGISADFAKGSSGGPVVDHRGRLAGLVKSTESVSFSREKDDGEVIQMVRKHCVPAHNILEMTGAIPKNREFPAPGNQALRLEERPRQTEEFGE